MFFFFFSSRRRHTRCSRDWSSDVCSSDLIDAFNTVNPMTGLTYAQQLAQSDDPNVHVDVNDYISTGSNREPYKNARSEEHTSELQSRLHLVCRLPLEKKKPSARPHASTAL